MKRRMPLKSEPVIAPEILEQAKRSLVSDSLRKPAKCSVCRRLKISAWRDNEQQMPAQE
jgi:hypothetical protein